MMTAPTEAKPSAPAPAPPEIAVARVGPLGAALRWLTPFRLISVLVLLGFGALVCYPLLRMLFSVFRDPAAAISEASQVEDLFSLIGETLLVVAASGAIALVIGTSLAWLNVRTDARMGALGEALPMVPFFLPPVAGAIGWVMLLSPRAGLLNARLRDLLGTVGIDLTSGPLDVFTWYGLIGLYTVYAVPLVYLVVSAGLRNMDSSLEEQSRICGASALKTFRAVTIPAIAPSLAGALLLVTWQGVGMYSLPAILTPGTDMNIMSVRIVYLLNKTYPPATSTALTLSALLVIFVLAAWYLQTRVVASGRYATVGGKGARSTIVKLRGWKWPARIAVILYVFVTTVLPVAGLMLVAFNNLWSPNIDWGNLSLQAFRVTLSDVSIRDSIENSLYLGVTGASIGVAVATILSLFFLGTRSRTLRFADGMLRVPSVIPHIVVAIGFLLALGGAPFQLAGTVLILMLCYIIVWTPQGLAATDAAASQVGNELAEASRVSGASWGRTVVKVYLPLMSAGVAAAWVLLFVRMIGDLNVSVILAGAHSPVVGSQLLVVYEGSSYANLAVLAVLLTAISAVTVSLMLIISRVVGRRQNYSRRKA